MKRSNFGVKIFLDIVKMQEIDIIQAMTNYAKAYLMCTRILVVGFTFLEISMFIVPVLGFVRLTMVGPTINSITAGY